MRPNAILFQISILLFYCCFGNKVPLYLSEQIFGAKISNKLTQNVSPTCVPTMTIQ